jgi:hypothetical protein
MARTSEGHKVDDDDLVIIAVIGLLLMLMMPTPCTEPIEERGVSLSLEVETD